jgi:hypothetical protein
MNGDVTLHDIGSSAVVNTMNGEISATFKHAPVKPVSLSSMNGEIDLRLPSDTKANLRMRTHNGSIRTNFSEGALQAKTEKTVHVSADARPEAQAEGSRGEGSTRDVDREIAREVARETARADREQAKLAREVAKAVAQANQIAASVTASLNNDGVVLSVPPVPPMPPMPNFGGKSIVGTLNGGGVDIKLTSMNGTITLRETK